MGSFQAPPLPAPVESSKPDDFPLISQGEKPTSPPTSRVGSSLRSTPVWSMAACQATLSGSWSTNA